MKPAFAVALLAVAPLVFAQSGGMKDMDVKGMEMQSMPKTSDKSQVHKGKGVVKSVDSKKAVVTLAHEPIPSMNWPAMTMGFKARDGKMIGELTRGRNVEFEFVPQGKDYFITSAK